MNHKPQPPVEISPDFQIQPPFYAKPGEPIPAEVRSANTQAAQQINAHKDNFIKICLEGLYTDEQVGETMLKFHNQPEAYIPALLELLDPAKLKLTLRDDRSPILILPSHHHPDDRKQTGHLRHTGHTLSMSYQDKWLGTMTIEYNDGRINIDITTKNDEP